MDFYDESHDLVKNNQDKDLNDKSLTSLDSVTVKREPSSDDDLSNKKYIDDQLDTNTIVRLNDDSIAIDRYLQVHVQNISYTLQIYNKTQIKDTTKMIYPNTGNDLLQNWKIFCNNKYNEGKPSDFIKSTKTNSPTGFSGATVLPPIGNSFMYIECSGKQYNTSNDDVFVSFERTDILQNSNITFYHNIFPISDITKKGMGKLEIQLLRNGVWQTEFTIEKDTNISTLSTDWTLLNLNAFSQPNYGIKLLYSEINTAHADMCFSDINITHASF